MAFHSRLRQRMLSWHRVTCPTLGLLMTIEGTFLAPRRIRALIPLGGVAAVCACSSTHPTATVVVTPADFARHVDSLYAATGNTNRQTFLTYLEYAPAFG